MIGGVLSQIQRMMFKVTASSFDGDVNSLEAIGDAVAALNNISAANVNTEVDTALNTAIPASNNADSVNDILLDQVKPRLPTAGILQTAYFRKGVEAILVFPIYDKDGDPVASAAGLDSEVSKDGGAFSDCTNEAVEISNGFYKLTLTATEMNCDILAIIVKTSTTDAKNTCTVIYTSGPGA